MTSPRRVLLVDDEPFMLEMCFLYLSEAGFEVEKVGDGAVARDRLLQKEFDALVCDLRVPHVNGMELLRCARDKSQAIKLMVITGFAAVTDTMNARDLGCDVLLLKPFTRAAFLQAVEATFVEKNLEISDATQFARIPADGFCVGVAFPHPVFIRLFDGKFLKVAHSSADLDQSRMAQFLAKGITDFWILRETFMDYLSIALEQSSMPASPNGQVKGRQQKFRHACEVAVENLRIFGINESSIQYAQKSLDHIIDEFLSQKQGPGLLDLFGNSPASQYSHAVICALFSAIAGKTMGKNDDECRALAMGGFLHDIGIYRLPQDFQGKDPRAFSKEEQKTYQQHPLLGLEEIQRFVRVPGDVYSIVLQHHENPMGKGYPGGLKRGDLSPLTLIVGAVDEFCGRIHEHEPSHRSRVLPVIDAMSQEESGYFDEISLLALRAILTSTCPEQARTHFDEMKRKQEALL